MQTSLKRDFPTQADSIPDYRVSARLRAPRYGSVLKAMGVIRIEEVAATTTRPPYVRTEIVGIISPTFSKIRLSSSRTHTGGDLPVSRRTIVRKHLGLADAFGIDIRFKRLGIEMENFLTKDATHP